MKANMVGGLVAAVISGGALGATPAPQHPVKLVVEQRSQEVVISVVGDSTLAFRGGYSLDVTSGTNNRSVQRGNVELAPDQPVTLVHLALGQSGKTNWSAHLSVVDGAGLPLYEERAS